MEKLLDKNFIRKNSLENSTKKINLNEIYDILPIRLREFIKNIDIYYLDHLEEIRLRVDKPLIINCEGKDFFLTETGISEYEAHNNIMVTQKEIETGFQLITNYSAYALEEEIKNGFITVSGGHRVGICGKTILENSNVKTIKDVSGLNIRISREVIGCGEKIIKYIIKKPDSIYNSLIISPPQCGKTTILRDIVRLISNGIPRLGFNGVNVAVVDERSELAGCYNGIPQKDIGIRTDVMDGCPKAKGMIMLIRSMAPRVIVTDEIGRDEDIYSIREAINAGVSFITTIHGNSLEEIKRRENMRYLIESKGFERIFILSNRPRVGTVNKIIDYSSNSILNDNLIFDGREIVAS